MEIRLLDQADAEPYRELRLRMLREHPRAFTSSHDEEAMKPLSVTRERLKARQEPPARFVLGAFSESGRLLGSVGLSVEEKRKQRHKALLFGMFTAAEARNRGVGRALLAECLDRAGKIPGLEQVNLTVTEGNGAERLYEAAGFERFGVEPRAIECNGEYFAKVHMVLRLASTGPHASAVRAARACLDGFTACFNAGDAEGMDRHLHFPHVIVAGTDVTVWQRPGQLAPDFFRKLAAAGWMRSTYEAREPILAGADKVHFLVRYSRRSADGTALSAHENVWVVTRVDGRWGIAVRSY